MSGGKTPPSGTARELGKFLEIQNLGLNLPFALAFLLVAAGGLPSLQVLLLGVVAFVSARNAGHSFNRWTDREFDRANPRTRDRALVTGRFSSGFALWLTALSGAALLVASALLNPLALLLAPLALLLILGYSYTKRSGWWTTPYLGLVQAITPAAAYVAVTGALPPTVWIAVAGMLLWGTAFETIHSLGDVIPDRASGLASIPTRFGIARSVSIVPALHAAALGGFAAFGVAAHLSLAYFLGLGVMALTTAWIDLSIRRTPERSLLPFRYHVVLGFAFLGGASIAVLAPGVLPLG